MEKLSLKELLKENEDIALDAEVILTEPIMKEDKLTGYKLFTRVNDQGKLQLAEINVSKQRYNVKTSKFEDNDEQELFYNEVVKTIFKDKIDTFTGKLKVFRGSSKRDGEGHYYMVYPTKSYLVNDDLSETNAQLSPTDAKGKPLVEPLVAKIIGAEYRDDFDLKVFLSCDDILRTSDNKPAVLLKKVRFMNYDKASNKYFKDDDKFLKLPFNFERTIKKQWNEEFKNNDFSSIIGQEVKIYIKNSNFGWYVEIVE